VPPQSKIFRCKIFFTAFGRPRGEPAVTSGQGRLEKILEENFRLAPAAASVASIPVLLWPRRGLKNLKGSSRAAFEQNAASRRGPEAGSTHNIQNSNVHRRGVNSFSCAYLLRKSKNLGSEGLLRKSKSLWLFSSFGSYDPQEPQPKSKNCFAILLHPQV